jgi:hypothetical protein
MKPFVFMLGAAPWPPDVTALQVYAVPDLQAEPGLAALIAGCRKVAAAWPVTVVDDPWLHITIEQITIRSGQDFTAAERGSLAAELRSRLAGFPPFSVTCGSPIANRAGILLDLSPDDRLEELHRHVRAAVHSVLGPGSTEYPVLPAHLTIAYAREDASSDEVQSGLRRKVRPSHAPLRVGSVYLVEVRPDLEGKQILWDQGTAVEIPLAGMAAVGDT